MERRGEVIDYVRRKYGERCVSQIVTFGTLGAKSVVTGRVLGWSYTDADRLAKMIPNELNITLGAPRRRIPISGRHWRTSQLPANYGTMPSSSKG